MVKRTIAVMMILAATLCLAVKADAADTPRYTKDDTWLIYMYICGTDLEEKSYVSTKNIGEMQHIELPPNVKVLLYASGAKTWHHPKIKDGGDGFYLYSSNRLEKVADFDRNIGDPKTLASFLKYGAENFEADHKVLIFRDHGGVSGICYDSRYDNDYLSYDELNSAFASVYGNSSEEPPFELIGFGACVSASYELANSVADFSRYMIGSECSEFGWYFTPWIAALSKDTSMSGAELGKAICDSAMKSYDEVDRRTHTFSVIDLTKMPELREAYESYFDEALTRSNEETGFVGAFARAAESRTADRYSNWYTDLGLLANNTKSIMPETSNKLLKAIDKAVVYNKRGAYLKSRGISTYYPYISPEETSETPGNSGANYFNLISKQNSNYAAQKELYGKLLSLDISELTSKGVIPIEINSNDHLIAKLTPEQMKNISSIKCILFPLDEDGQFKLGGAILFSADDLKINWKKGTITENFRGVQPMFDGQRIFMYPSASGRGHTFYTVPILYDGVERELIVRYNTSSKKYEITGFGSIIENGMMRIGGLPAYGHIITPLYMEISDDATNEIIGLTQQNGKLVNLQSRIATVPGENKNLFLKYKLGEPFVFTRDSTITNKKLTGACTFTPSFSPRPTATKLTPIRAWSSLKKAKFQDILQKELRDFSNL